MKMFYLLPVERLEELRQPGAGRREPETRDDVLAQPAPLVGPDEGDARHELLQGSARTGHRF